MYLEKYISVTTAKVKVMICCKRIMLSVDLITSIVSISPS